MSFAERTCFYWKSQNQYRQAWRTKYDEMCQLWCLVNKRDAEKQRTSLQKEESKYWLSCCYCEQKYPHSQYSDKPWLSKNTYGCATTTEYSKRKQMWLVYCGYGSMFDNDKMVLVEPSNKDLVDRLKSGALCDCCVVELVTKNVMRIYFLDEWDGTMIDKEMFTIDDDEQ